MPPKRKFQVCNGYLLEFDQLARVLNFMTENPSIKRVYRKELEENTGLSNRQLESLVSIGSALGLIQPRRQILTPAGSVIVKYDIFIEANGLLDVASTTAPLIAVTPATGSQLRAEIDAHVAHLYGLSRDDFSYILDTFPVLKRKEEAAFGEFMSKRKCLEEYDRIGSIL